MTGRLYRVRLSLLKLNTKLAISCGCMGRQTGLSYYQHMYGIGVHNDLCVIHCRCWRFIHQSHWKHWRNWSELNWLYFSVRIKSWRIIFDQMKVERLYHIHLFVWWQLLFWFLVSSFVILRYLLVKRDYQLQSTVVSSQ